MSSKKKLPTDHQLQSHRPELLAPAGSLEAFFAAVDAGADAVYAGLKDFSARAKAKNFSLADIESMTRFMHASGKRLYVTINTLIKENELSHLIDTLSALESFRVDALIIQDLAVWQLARKHFPGLELHASTQMTIHNSAGVKMLERMGFTRAVLARELTLPEIAAIRRQTTLELEHFIHGALCFSFSGQCYFSSFLGGKSGNRGRCAQPCRRSYRHRNQQGFFFSPNDLSAIDLLPELQNAGICSLKIEGRMKSAEYVYKVIGAYRQVLDAPELERSRTLATAKELLKESFGRRPTRGFLAGSQPDDMAIPSARGATGRYLGELRQIQGTRLTFPSSLPLHLGDRLRVQPRNDKSGSAFTLKQLYIGSRQVTKTPAGTQVTVIAPFEQGFQRGDSLFLVATTDAYTLSENGARRRLTGKRSQGETVDLQLDVTPDNMTISARIDDWTYQVEMPVTSAVAEHHPLNEEILKQLFAATADEPFTLGKLSCGTLPAVVMPPGQLKQLRRDYYRILRTARQQYQQTRRQKQRAAALESLLPPETSSSGRAQLRVMITDARDQTLLRRPEIDSLILPLTRSGMQQSSKLRRQAAKIIWDLPMILLDADWQDMRSAVRTLVQEGFSQFRISNLGHLPIFDELQNLTLYGGYRLTILNSQAAAALEELGIDDAELYIEDDHRNLTAILSRRVPLPVSLMVYGHPPLLVSRIQVRSLRGDQPIISDRGDRYRMHQRQGLSWLYSETPFSFIGEMRELQQQGCRAFVVDLTQCGASTPQAQQVLEALGRGTDPPGSIRFNLETGLE